MSSETNNTPIQAPEISAEELQAKLADIRTRIASVDHESFGGNCEAFRHAIMEAVPPEDMNLLLDHDPLISNLCCLFMQAGEHFAMEKLTNGLSQAISGAMFGRTTDGSIDLPGGMRIEVIRRRRDRSGGSGGNDGGPQMPPTA